MDKFIILKAIRKGEEIVQQKWKTDLQAKYLKDMLYREVDIFGRHFNLLSFIRKILIIESNILQFHF